MVTPYLLSVGTSVAKAVLKLWLRDDTIALAATTSVVDALKSHTSDVIARRAGNRQFEQLAEQVAEEILKISDFYEESDAVAASKLAAETLEVADFSLAIIVGADADSGILARSFKQHVPSYASEMGELCRKLLSEILESAAEYVIDISRSLPEFTTRSIAEVLRRETALLARVEEIFREVEKIRDANIATEKETRDFETKYRRSVVRSLGDVRLFGVDTSPATRKYELSVAYISLQLSIQGMPEDAFDWEFGLDDAQEQLDEDEEPVLRIGAEELGDYARRLLITGPPGSGKTTLLQWLAVSACMGGEGRGTPRIPFFIRLRQFAGRQLPSPDDLVGLISTALAPLEPNEWTNGCLEMGQAIILIDGVDELPVSDRSEFERWLADLVTVFPENRFVITSRPHAAPDLSDLDFRRADLLPMLGQDIERFVEHWHDAVSRNHVGDDVPHIEEARLLLLNALAEQRDVLKLCSSPLLCSIVCALHLDRTAQLPRKRVELYRACISMMFRRDSERRIASHTIPLAEPQAVAVLKDLAYFMLRNGWSELPLEKTEEQTLNVIERFFEHGRDLEPESVVTYLVERVGILRRPGHGLIDFPHKTFQEYLSAQAILDARDLGVLARNLDDDSWREVTVLAAGLARPGEADELIRGLLRRSAQSSLSAFTCLSCAEAAIELDSCVRTSVLELVERFLPPRSLADGTALAAAGESALPYLRYRSDLSALEARSCIRALSKIEGRAANDVLRNYATDPRPSVLTEFLDRCGASDTKSSFDTFIERALLPHTADLEGASIIASGHFNLDWIPSIEPTSLDVRDSPRLRSLSPLRQASNLASVAVSNCDAVVDFSPLSVVRGDVRVRKCRTLDTVHWLEGAEVLSLEIVECQSLEDFDLEGENTSLKELSIYGCKNLNSIAGIQGVRELTSLQIRDTQIWSAEFLSSLGLHSLRFDSVGYVSFSSIRLCLDLRRLEVTRTQVGGLNQLSGVAIEVLDLSHSFGLGEKDVETLASMRSLRALNLAGCTDLTTLLPLAESERLEVVVGPTDGACVGLPDRIQVVTEREFNEMNSRSTADTGDVNPP